MYIGYPLTTTALKETPCGEDLARISTLCLLFCIISRRERSFYKTVLCPAGLKKLLSETRQPLHFILISILTMLNLICLYAAIKCILNVFPIDKTLHSET